MHVKRKHLWWRRVRVSAVAVAALVMSVVSASGATASTSAAPINRNASLSIITLAVPSNLDPAFATSQSYVYDLEIYDTLLQVDVHNNVLPEVATKWSFTPDGKHFDLTLRTDVQFHDGTPVDATAVKASILRDKTYPGSLWAHYLKNVRSVTVLGKYQVRLNLSGPIADLPALLATPAGAIINPKVITSKQNLATDSTNAGSGPMVVKTFTPSESITFVRASNKYWDPHANNLAELTITPSGDSATRMSAFQSGQVQLAELKPDQFPQARALAQSGTSKFYISPSDGVEGLLVRNEGPYFSNIYVRKALNYAVDRSALCPLLNGAGQVNEQLWGPDNVGYVPSLNDAYSYNPGVAKQLLAKGGFPNGFSFDTMIYAGGIQPHTQFAEAVKAQLAQVGVTMNIVPDPPSHARLDFLNGKYATFMDDFAETPSPAQMVSENLLGGFNITAGRYQQLYGLANIGNDQTKSDAVRAAAYKEISKIVTDNAIWVPLCTSTHGFIATSKVLNVASMPWQSYTVFSPKYLAVSK